MPIQSNAELVTFVLLMPTSDDRQTNITSPLLSTVLRAFP